MHLDVPDNKRRKIESEQYNSDDDFSDYIKSGNPEVDVEKKKRRGKIEKRRRDRINNSLTELKELVPNAVVKQNTAKLEKAEILKLTVDYLKELKNKDPSRFFNGSSHIYENRLTGFRECLNELSKYLLQRVGMSNHNPLYQGLIEHLQYCYQCFATQGSYQQENTFYTDPSQRYLQIHSPFMGFESPINQAQPDTYQKLPCWAGSIHPLYLNNNLQYTNNGLSTSQLPMPCNSSQNRSQYELSVPVAVTNAGNSIPASHNLSATQQIAGSIFNSFCNAPNSYFHQVASNTVKDSLV